MTELSNKNDNYHASRKADDFIIRFGLKKSRSLPNKQLFLFLKRFFRVPQQRRLKMDGDVLRGSVPRMGRDPLFIIMIRLHTQAVFGVNRLEGENSSPYEILVVKKGTGTTVLHQIGGCLRARVMVHQPTD